MADENPCCPLPDPGMETAMDNVMIRRETGRALVTGASGSITAAPEAVRFNPEDTKGECRVLAEKEANIYLQRGWRLVATVNGKYIVNRDNDSVISDAREQVLDAERKAEEWEEKWRQAEDERACAVNEAGILRHENERLDAKFAALLARHDLRTRTQYRLEEDLAKVQDAIGSLKWKEIVGR